MPDHRSELRLTPGVRRAYDQYGPIIGRLVDIARVLATAPLDDLAAANAHMQATGTRYDVSAMRHIPLDDESTAALNSHLRFFEAIGRFANDYRALRDETGGDQRDPDADTRA